MSAPRIKSDYDQLTQIAQSFTAQAEAAKNTLQRLQQQVGVLRGGDWIGKGATAFYAEMDGAVLPALRRLENALSQAARVTNQINTIMQTAEDEAARLFRRGEAVTPVDAAPGTTAPAPGGADAGSGNAAPPPRVYILNGINSKGGFYLPDGTFIPADQGSYNLQQRLLERGYDARAMPAVYDTNLQGTNLQGTKLGGWLSPVDWLTGAGASVVNTVTGAGAGVLNTAIGVQQVATEYLLGSNGPYTQQTFDFIKQDLERNPLLPGQQLILAGHSGAGAPLSNLTEMLETRLGVDVNGLVTMGSPIVNHDLASQYAETVVDMRHGQDLIGAPYFRSDEGKWLLGGNPLNLNQAIPALGGDLLLRDRPANVHYEEIGNVGFWDKLQFWKTGDGHTQSWQSPEVVGVFEKYFPVQSPAPAGM